MDPYNKGVIVTETTRIREIARMLHARERKLLNAAWDVRETREMFEAELPPAELPPPSRRTPAQERLARCPRCRSHLVIGEKVKLTNGPPAGTLGETKASILDRIEESMLDRMEEGS